MVSLKNSSAFHRMIKNLFQQGFSSKLISFLARAFVKSQGGVLPRWIFFLSRTGAPAYNQPRHRVRGYALHVFPGETVSRLRSHETRLPGYRRVVALIRESGNGDSETFEPSPTTILLARLELGGAQLDGRRALNAIHNGWAMKHAITVRR